MINEIRKKNARNWSLFHFENWSDERCTLRFIVESLKLNDRHAKNILSARMNCMDGDAKHTKIDCKVDIMNMQWARKYSKIFLSRSSGSGALSLCEKQRWIRKKKFFTLALMRILDNQRKKIKIFYVPKTCTRFLCAANLRTLQILLCQCGSVHMYIVHAHKCAHVINYKQYLKYEQTVNVAQKQNSDQ